MGSHARLKLLASANSAVADFATTRMDSAQFSIKGRLPELVFTQVCLTFRLAGDTLLALDCIFGARFVLQRSHIEKTCRQHLHVSLFGLRGYRTRRRSENNLSAPALHQRRYRIQS